MAAVKRNPCDHAAVAVDATIWGDPAPKETYYPDDFKGKLYLAGDGASTDEEVISASSAHR